MLKQSHPSKRRNLLIADAFFRLGYIETWGRGFDKIFKEFKTAKMAEPTISEFASGFQISLTRNDKLAVNVPDGRLIRILELLKQNSKMQLMEMARIFSVSKKTIIRDIEKLKEAGKIRRIGSEKSGYWEVID